MNKIYSFFRLASENKFLYCINPITAHIYYRDFKINLVTGKKTKESIKDNLDIFSNIEVQDNIENPQVFHLFYELGFLFNTAEDLIPNSAPLLIHIEYRDSEVVDHEFFDKTHKAIDLKLTEYPSLEYYEKNFKICQEHLTNGNCYQVNFTNQFFFNFEKDIEPMTFVNEIWRDQSKIGAFAHCTYIDSLRKLFLSNTPECLFQIRPKEKKFEITSMPIKGTLPLHNEEDFSKVWKELTESEKEQAELYIIIDLIRNDLSKINGESSNVDATKLPLKVPGILHQYAVITNILERNTNYLDIIKNTFPGGSITGAPKKRVMEIIQDIEKYPRGNYCGSTLVVHKSLQAASINIRSATIDFEQLELTYGSGGGITIKSEMKAEFDEMYLKMKSFVELMSRVNINIS